MSRAYKNKKFNTDNYTSYGVSSKYFGVQARRFPGSIKKQYCDETGDGYADATYTKRRCEAVRKGSGCVYRSMLPPDFGPSGLGIAPLFGPTELSSAFAVPSVGPSELISTAVIPVSGPQNLNGTVEPMLTPELIGSVVLEVQGLFEGISLDGYYRQVEGLEGYFNPDGDWLTDTVFDGLVYERVIDEGCVPTVYTLWLYKARYFNANNTLLEGWEFGNVQPAQDSRSTRKQVNSTGVASTTGAHGQYSNNHESPFRVSGDLTSLFNWTTRRDGAPCE